MRCSFALALGMVLLVVSVGGAAADPSFDCSRAAAADEKAICASPELAKLDSLVAAAFASFQPDYQPRETVARLLLQDRQSCGADTACIAAAQWNALETYGGDAPWVEAFVTGLVAAKAAAAERQETFSSSPPQKPAECLKTRIKTITTRFGNGLAGSAADTGIFIAYDNGGAIYSYDRGKNFDGVAVGQPAVLCLVSVPRDCPDGDGRGRIYYSLDLATRASWLSADSEHGCGGA